MQRRERHSEAPASGGQELRRILSVLVVHLVIYIFSAIPAAYVNISVTSMRSEQQRSNEGTPWHMATGMQGLSLPRTRGLRS